MDIALAYARLQRVHAWSAAEIGRRRGRSKGYVSVVLRVGRALDGLSDGELQLFRTPRLTLLSLQRSLRKGMDTAAIRRMLLSLAITPVRDRRGARAAPPLRPRRRASAPAAHVWHWDESAAAHDPVAYLLAFLDHLRGEERELSARMRHLLSARGATTAQILTTHGMAQLAAAVTPRTGPGAAADDRRTLEALRQLDALVTEAAAIGRVLGGAPAAVEPTSAVTGGFRALGGRDDPELAAALERDLRG